MRFRIPQLSLCLFILLTLVGCQQGSRSTTSVFYIVPTGNLIGQIWPCHCKGNPMGGLSRRASVFHRKFSPEKRDSVLVVDAGNFTSMHYREAKERTQLVLAGMAKYGVQVINLGMRDLRATYETLANAERDYGIQIVSANITREESEQLAFDPYRIVNVKAEKGTMKVAVVGVANTGENRYIPPNTGLATIEPLDGLNAALRRLGEKADFILLLTDADDRMVASWLAQLDEGLHVDGVFSSSTRPHRMKPVNLRGVPYTTNGRLGKFFDLVRMTPPEAEGTGWTIYKDFWPLKPNVKEDPEMEAFLQEQGELLGISDDRSEE